MSEANAAQGQASIADVKPPGRRRERRKRRETPKRKNRQRQRLIRNLVWLIGGLAIGLPILAVVLVGVSRL